MSPANDNHGNPHWSHVEVTGGFVTSVTIEDQGGVRDLPCEAGKFKFFVDAVEHDGGRLGLHSVDDHAAAMNLARETCNALELDLGQIRDMVRGRN